MGTLREGRGVSDIIYVVFLNGLFSYFTTETLHFVSDLYFFIVNVNVVLQMIIVFELLK